MQPLAPLPIDELLPEIVAALTANPCLVLEAPPGAGKTTRVPQALLRSSLISATRSAERTASEIWIAQPRRIAARLAAERVALELGERVGQTVGYHVRFEDISSPATRIRFLTEGVLVRRFLSDPELTAAKIVILDEFHERHLHSDLSLALLRQLQRTRRDLKLLVMSATLEAAAIARFLDACPLLRSSGRQYPLEIEYLPKPDERPLEKQVASAVRRCLLEREGGDTLVFLPGAAEIRRATQALEKLALEAETQLLQLHGDLPLEQQARVVEKTARRKIVLATNVAESSVTVPGVTHVVDSGLARSALHSPWSGLSSVELTKISRASATQRAGRAGRLGPGKALRLYTRGDFESRPEQDKPELERSDLAETLLTLLKLGLDVSALSWLTPPPSVALKAASELLLVLGAVLDGRRLSTVGERLAELPLHPRLGRLVLAGQERGVARDACRIAALVSERDIRLEQRTHFAGQASRASDATGDSDALELLDRFEEALEIGSDRGRLRALELDAPSVAAVDRTRRQLERLVQDRHAAPATPEARDRALRQAILSAYPDRVARRRAPGRADVILANGSVAKLADTSVVRHAQLLVALEASARGTHGSEIRLASAIEPEWLLDYPELCAERDELVWNPERERVERVSQICCGSVVLEETRGAAPASAAASEVLRAAAQAKGVHFFDASGEAAELLARLATLGAQLANSKAGTDTTLTLEDLQLGRDASGALGLDRACEGLTSFDELKSLGLVGQIRARLSPKTLHLLETWVPEHVLVGARRLRVHYEQGQGPWVESRLQDFFGLTTTPHVCAGQLPLTLHLLAPNQRAVQVTRDLEGFWQRHYPQIRKELCRRYPRHPWPDDGRTAAQPPARPPRR